MRMWVDLELSAEDYTEVDRIEVDGFPVFLGDADTQDNGTKWRINLTASYPRTDD